MGNTTVRDDALPIFEETLSLTKREVATGTLRVTTKTATHEEIAEATLERDTVDVVRVPVDLPIDKIPSIRTEGDTTIVPVVEERLVITKQLVLVEELHIRRRTEQEVVQTPVELRRQEAVVERMNANGIITSE